MKVGDMVNFFPSGRNQILIGKLSLYEAEIQSLRAKLRFLLEGFISSEDGKFTFPDGDTWDCKKEERI